MGNNDASFVPTFTEIVNILDKSTSWKEGLKNVLGVFVNSAGVNRAAVYQTAYFERNTFRLLRVAQLDRTGASAAPGGFGPERMGKSQIAPDAWEALTQGDCLCENGPLVKHFSGAHELTITPLHTGESLFGLLFLDSTGLKPAAHAFQEKLHYFCGLLRLWLGKQNMVGQLDEILEFLPYPTCVLRADGQMVVWNQAFVDRTGWAKDRIIGKDSHTCAIPFYGERRPIAPSLLLEPDPEWASRYHEFNMDGDAASGLAYCPEVAGGAIFLTFKTALLHDINNRVIGAIHCVRDVTKEKEVEKELRRSESRHRTIIEFAKIGMLLMTRSEIVYHNEFVTDLFKRMGCRVGLDSFWGLIHPEDLDGMRAVIDRCFTSPGPTSGVEFRIQDGSRTFYFRAQAGILENQEQPTVHFIMDDITDQKILAEKARLNDMKLCHENRLTSLGTMAAGIAHELNQPLNTIRVVAEGLLFGRDEGWPLDEEELMDDMKMI